MDIGAALSGLNAAITTLKTLRSIEKAYDQATLKSQIVDLMEHVSDAKIALLEAKEEIATRDAEIAALTAKIDSRVATVDFRGQTYAKNAEGGPTGTPFCGACIVNDGTQIRFNKSIGNAWQCPRCRAVATGIFRLP